MTTSYKNWCRLCGDLQSQPVEDKNLEDFIKKLFEIESTIPLRICQTCESQLSEFQLFVQRTKEINEMFKGLGEEDEEDLCIRRLNAYRTHFHIPIMIEPETTPVLEPQVDDEVFEIIEETENVEIIEENDTIVEEILVETVDKELEIESQIVDESIETEDEKTFMYHMSNSNKLLQLFTFNCHLCDMPAFPNMKVLTDHCHAVHNSRPSVRCCSDECGKMLQTWRRLMIHKERHFPSGEAMTCGICHTVFATKSGFENHKKTHERKFICSYCAKPFSEQKTLRFHEQTHQIPLEDRKHFECPHCHHKFITKQACQNHVSMKHKKVVTVTCSVDGCGKGFFTRKAMLEHQRTHRVKSFKCNRCHFMSKTKSQLNAHMERHSKDEDKMRCDKCGMVFDTVKKWKSHSAAHMNEKMYKCNKCNAKFTEKLELTSHLNLHNEI